MDALYIGNDHLLEAKDLTDQDGTLLSGGQVRATLYEHDYETEIGGTSWPVTLSETDPGQYSATLPYDLELVSGRVYFLKLTAVAQGKHLEQWARLRATYRHG